MRKAPVADADSTQDFIEKPEPYADTIGLYPSTCTVPPKLTAYADPSTCVAVHRITREARDSIVATRIAVPSGKPQNSTNHQL